MKPLRIEIPASGMRNIYVFFIGFLIFGMTKALACSCTEFPGTLKQKITRNFNRSDWVITGNVISIQDSNPGETRISSGDVVLYEFEVISILKGVPNIRRMTISRSRLYDTFEIGQTYLVHGILLNESKSSKGQRRKFRTSDCRKNKNVRFLSKKERRIYRRLKARNLRN